MTNPHFILVDGIERARHNSLGDAIDHTEDGLIRFWRWFGNSKIVDKRGRPLVVFHGTDTIFDQFKHSSDIGFHFGTEQAGKERRSKIGGFGLEVEEASPSEIDYDSAKAINGEIGGDAKEDLYALLLRKLDNPKRDLKQVISAMDADDIATTVAEYKDLPDSANLAKRIEKAKTGVKYHVRLNGDIYKILDKAADANRLAKQLSKTLAKPMPVYLRIENPLSMADLGVWPAQGIARDAQFTTQEMQKVCDSGDEKAQYEMVRGILNRRSHDGIVYKNAVEDAGSMSYIALSPHQIKSVSNYGLWDGNDAHFRAPHEQDMINAARNAKSLVENSSNKTKRVEP